MVKFCCGQICSGMSLSLFPLESPVFPGSHIGISVPQICKNQRFSSPARWAERSSALGPALADSRPDWWRGSASIIPPRALSLPHLPAHQHLGLIRSWSCLSLSHQPSLSAHPLILTAFSRAPPLFRRWQTPSATPCCQTPVSHPPLVCAPVPFGFAEITELHVFLLPFSMLLLWL